MQVMNILKIILNKETSIFSVTQLKKYLQHTYTVSQKPTEIYRKKTESIIKIKAPKLKKNYRFLGTIVYLAKSLLLSCLLCLYKMKVL